MGRLVRFIHNRDLATENISRAWVRHALLLSAPAADVKSLHAAMAAGGLSLVSTSLLRSANEVLESANGSPGEFDIRFKRSPRDNPVLDPAPAMAASLQDSFAKCDLGVPSMQGIVSLASSLYINGRPYARGDYVEYVLQIPRRQAARDIQLVTEKKFYKVARIADVLLVPTSRETPHGGEIFLGVVEMKVEQTIYGIRRIGVPPNLDEPNVTANLLYIHVDSVLFKLKVVPDVGHAPHFVAIRIWEAR